jgi:hypothetical protein
MKFSKIFPNMFGLNQALAKFSNFVRTAHLASKNGNFVRTARSGLKNAFFIDCYDLNLGKITLHPSRHGR